MKLSTKILLVILLAALETIAAMTLVSYFSIRQVLEETVGETQLTVAEKTMETIDRILYERLVDIEVLATDGDFRNILLTAQEGSYDGTDLADAKLRDFLIRTGMWEELMLVDSGGTVIAKSGREKVQHPVSDELADNKAFLEALQSRSYYSDVVELSNGRTTVVFAAPVRHELSADRVTVGVLIGHVAWPVITEVIEGLAQEAVLLNTTGQIIYENHEGHNYSLFSDDHLTEEFMQEAFNGEDRSFRTKSTRESEEEVLVSIATQRGFLEYHGSDWRLVFETPTQIAFEATQKSLISVFLALVPIVLFAVVTVLYLINRFVIKPILSLTKVARSVTSGDFKIRADVETNDELGDLSKAFNSMLNRQQYVREEIEAEVQRRTEELESLNKALVGREMKMIELKKRLGESSEAEESKTAESGRSEGTINEN